ncbi:hypothetical protein [Pseudomonas sp. NUPR-001]|uniref:hypothetical protein n=1 Tax=Pseudomonas sp. NUPR-001 TaxID=3416058 RepID=UPI003F99AADD
MKHGKTNQSAENPILWLKEFSIKVSSGNDRVYNNGRQQIEISLTVEPQANQEISDAQFNTLKPVYLDDDGNYVALPELTSNESWFYSSSENPNFDYLPSTFTPEPLTAATFNEDGSLGQLLTLGPEGNWLDANNADPVTSNTEISSTNTQVNGARRVKRFYVQSHSRAGTDITLYACIEKNQETIYYSKDSESEVTLIAESTPAFKFPEDYNWTQKKVSLASNTYASEDNDARFIHEFSLSPRHVRFSYAEFHPDTAQSKGMIRWQDHTPGQTFASHVGVALPHARNIHYNDNIKLGAQFPARKATTISAENPDSIVVLLQGDNQIPYYSEGFDQQGPLKLQAYDRYGTLHSISIAFDDSEGSAFDKRTKLTVSTSNNDHINSDDIHITHFQVKGLNSDAHKQICKLYNNGLQQTYVNIVITAVNSRDEPISLPQDVLDKILLVDYDTGTALSPSDYSISRRQSDRDKRFHIIQSTYSNEASSATPNQGGQSITYWISTLSRTNLTIGARLVHDGITYHTYQTDVEPGGKTVSGKSNSAAVISPQLQDYNYRKEDFSLERKNSSVDLTPGIYDVDTYTIKINSANHFIVWSDAPTSVWMYDYIGNLKANYLAYYQCNEVKGSTLYFGTIPQRVPINTNTGDATAARVKGYKYDASGERYFSLLVTYRDQHGNGHAVYLKPYEEANFIALG